MRIIGDSPSSQIAQPAMILEELVKPDNVLCNAHARSKKHCLEILSELLARADDEMSNEEIFAKLIERERLGCTSLEKGIAFPHCLIDVIANSRGALMKLSAPVDFDASDGIDVDLVFGLLVPTELDDRHHADIKMITESLMDRALRARMRAATSSSELYKALLTAQAVAGDHGQDDT
jgi:PTS system nitrogen regulatory IIA component